MPGASEPRLTLLRRQGFRSVFQNRLRGLSNRSIVVVGNYCIGPITAEPCRAKARPLRPRRSCFAPITRLFLHPGYPVCGFPVSSVRRPGRNQAISDRNRAARSIAGLSPMTNDWPLPWKLVEAPGTAPGSEWFIPTAIYRHSRQAGTANIGGSRRRRKSAEAILRKESDFRGCPIAWGQGSGWDILSRTRRPRPLQTALRVLSWSRRRARGGMERLQPVSQRRLSGFCVPDSGPANTCGGLPGTPHAPRNARGFRPR